MDGAVADDKVGGGHLVVNVNMAVVDKVSEKMKSYLIGAELSILSSRARFQHTVLFQLNVGSYSMRACEPNLSNTIWVRVEGELRKQFDKIERPTSERLFPKINHACQTKTGSG